MNKLLPPKGKAIAVQTGWTTLPKTRMIPLWLALVEIFVEGLFKIVFAVLFYAAVLFGVGYVITQLFF